MEIIKKYYYGYSGGLQAIVKNNSHTSISNYSLSFNILPISHQGLTLKLINFLLNDSFEHIPSNISSLHVTFSNDSQDNKKIWDIQKIATSEAKKLIIENICLGQNFIEAIAFTQNNNFPFAHLVHLSFINCQLTEEHKKAIQKSFIKRNELKKESDPKREWSIDGVEQ
jgi:hypothetical protein